MNMLMDPRAVAWVFWMLMAAEVAWTVRLVRGRQQRRQQLAGWLSTGDATPALSAWMAAWASRSSDGVPLARGGRLMLTEPPPALSGTISHSPVGIAPGLLTALGVLGTFLGIHGGLSGIDLDALESTEALLAAASGLMAGMKTAFATSVAGMLHAAVAMVVLSITAAGRRRWAASERDRWRAVAAVGGGNDLRPAAAAMAEAAERLSVAMAGQQDSLIREVITAFQEEALAPLTARLEESAATSQQTAEAVATLQESLGGITTRLADSVEILDRFNQQTHEKLQEFTDSMADTLDRFQADSRDALTQTGAAIREAVEASIDGMTAQREAFEASADAAAATFRGIRTDLEGALATQSAEQRQTLTTLRDANLDILDRAEQAYTRQADAITAVGEQAAATMHTAGEQLDTQLTRFREDYDASLCAFLAAQSDQLDTILDRHRQGLDGVIDRLTTTFDAESARRASMSAEVDAAIRQLKEGAVAVSDLAETVGLNSAERLTQLLTLSEQMTGQTEALQHSYEGLAGQLSASLAELDGASTKLCAGLYRAADTLVTAAQRAA